MKKKILLILCLTIFHFSTNAQQANTGIVLNALDQQPLGGATITFDKKTVVYSDNLGHFNIPPIKGILFISISYVGYLSLDTTIQESSKHQNVFKLHPHTGQLSEVIISNGYQDIPKERATGSFEQINNKLFNQQVGTDVLSRLPAVANSLFADKTTGGSGGRLTIRGFSTIQGPKDPLYVVDNFPYDGNINNINPNDVESITILKDAAASSIWGARASNGVVVITTKKGRFNQPITIAFNSNVSLSGKPDLSYIPQMSASDFIDVEKMLYDKGYYKSQISSSSHPALSPVVELLIKKTNGTLSATDADAGINALRNIDVRDDFSKYLYKNAVTQQYALSLQGGSNTIAWSASGGYDKNINNLDAGYDRITLRYQNTYKPIQNLQLTTGLWFTQSNNTSGRPGYGDITPKSGYYLFPYAQLADASGSSLPVVKDYEQNYLSTAGNGKLLDWKYYPLEDYKHAITKITIADIVVNTGINYRLWKGLSADVKYQYERQQSTTRKLYDQNSYFARDLVNRFTQISSSGVVTNNIPSGGILDLTTGPLQSNNIRGQLNFNQTWGQHDVTALAGGELRSINSTGTTNRFYGYNDNTLTYGSTAYGVQYPNFITGSNAMIPDVRDISDQTTRYVSYYANAAYTYQSKYVFSLSGRRDASNLFGLKTNDQWNPFWSAGVAWNLSDESFYHNSWLPYLKLRTTYGFSGNINPAMVAATTITYFAGTSPYTQGQFARFSNYYNPELKWETSRMINMAVDFRSKNNRLTGSIEYFQKKGTDLFGKAILDYTSGIGASVTKNVASMKGQGIDIQLNSLNVNGAVQWRTTLNFSYYKDQVVDYYLNTLQGSNFISYNNNVTISGVPGYPVYAVFAYKWAGLDPQTGDPRGYLNGQVSKDYTSLTGSGTLVSDLQYFGSAVPTKFGSFINTISYKAFTLDLGIVYKLGYYFRRNSINYSSLYANWLGNADFSKRWQKSGDETTTNVPSMLYPASSSRDNFYAGSAPLVEKGDHVRLQYINVGYDLSRAIRKNIGFKNLTVYINANNLGILWRANKSGIDPDYYNSIYPLVNPKTFALGIKGNF